MSIDSAKSFYSDLTSGKIKFDLKKLTAGNAEETMAYAHSHGYDFTEQEMLDALKHHGKSISMEQAEAVAGGDASTWTGAGVGAAAGAAACA